MATGLKLIAKLTEVWKNQCNFISWPKIRSLLVIKRAYVKQKEKYFIMKAFSMKSKKQKNKPTMLGLERKLTKRLKIKQIKKNF